MFKKIFTMVMCLCFILPCTLLLVACGGDTKYIEVVGVSNLYIVGDELDYENAEVHYFESETSANYQTIDLTADMVSGFSTSTVGTREMIITYDGLECKITYSVYTMDSVLESAKNNLLTNSFKILQSEGEYNSISEAIYNKQCLYFSISSDFDYDNDYDYTSETWAMMQNSEMYMYLKEYSSELNDYSYNLNKAQISFEDVLAEFIFVDNNYNKSIEIDNDYVVITSIAANNSSSTVQKFKDGKIISETWISYAFDEQESEFTNEVESTRSRTFEYNGNYQIPERPTNVEWVE